MTNIYMTKLKQIKEDVIRAEEELTRAVETNDSATVDSLSHYLVSLNNARINSTIYELERAVQHIFDELERIEMKI